MPAGDPYEYLRIALENVRKFNASPEVDEVETESGEKVTSLIQSILSGVQKDSEALMQGKMNPRAISRAYGQIESGGSPGGMPGGMPFGGPEA